MSTVFIVLLLVSVVLMLVGLINPRLIGILLKKDISRKKILATFSGLSLLFFVLIGITVPPTKVSSDREEVKGVNANQTVTTLPIASPVFSISPIPTLSPLPRPNTSPGLKPSPSPVVVVSPQQQTQELAPCGSYVNSAGQTVPSPCNYDLPPAGATAKCSDGTYSYSQSRRGTCSHHGGVAQWL